MSIKIHSLRAQTERSSRFGNKKMFNSKFRNYENKLFLIATTKEDDKVSEDITDETLTEGEKSFFADDDSDVEHLDGSSSSLQDDYRESTGGE